VIPIVTYQGGKQRLAGSLLDVMKVPQERRFVDLCCGTGALSLALVARGHEPEQIVMVDRGPFGLVWADIARGSFSLERLRAYCDAVPTDLRAVKSHMLGLASRPADADTSYVFLLLQAASFGGKAIWIEGDRWVHHGFRDYWIPTATSSRRSPVNPMMPMPPTLYDRAAEIVPKMRGIEAHCADVASFAPRSDDVIYLDPPYGDTTAYGYTVDVPALVRRLGSCWVSEGAALSAHSIQVSTGRAKGGISGKRTSVNEEWLSRFGIVGGQA
jgi:predicted RNA methylase